MFPEAVSTAGLPAGPGAYALLIVLPGPVEMSLRGRPTVVRAGRYIYCGSANGPGGIRARVARHLRRDKNLHWHVDHLTITGTVEAVVAAPGASECDLMARAAALPHAEIAEPGFGSSDCPSCPAHLVRLTVSEGAPIAFDLGSGEVMFRP